LRTEENARRLPPAGTVEAFKELSLEIRPCAFGKAAAQFSAVWQSLSVGYLDSPFSSPWSGRSRKTIEAPFPLTLVRPDGLVLLAGHALDYQALLFRVNQIIPRYNNSPAIDPIPRFLQPFNCRDPKRGPISKSLENVEFRTDF